MKFGKPTISLILLVFVAISPVLAENWADRHGSASDQGHLPQGTRFNPQAHLKAPLDLIWKADNLPTRATFGTATSPTVVSHTAYATMDNALYAWDLDSGQLKPGFPVKPAVESGMTTPVLAYDNIYAGTGNGIYAWRQDGGQVVPGFPVSTLGVITAPPIVVEGI